MSWFSLLKIDEHDWKEESRKKADKRRKLEARIRGLKEKLLRQSSIDPQMRSLETKKLIKMIENLEKELNEG